ncbi:response regulator transcription factor [Bdellovibrio bacteriovorus]|uniref:response regulator transcription factor n=1 Tax=Bdellovibrio bacteriovorus TaxID=959 RepID=UPI001E4F27D6|nr:response regulator transcription factor [Bdellovibrio bacteriovorus]
MSTLENTLQNSVSFFIVDDHPVTRHGLRVALTSLSPKIQCVGEASTVPAALQNLKSLDVNYVVLDHMLPGQSGMELITMAASARPDLKFMLVTQCEDAETLAQYQRMGVKVLLSKISAMDVLEDAVKCLIEDKNYLCPAFEKIMEEPRLTNVLTPRELEVVRMIAQGKTNKEVAACLECSEHTIKTHKTNVMRKLNLSNAVEISVWALKRNLA